MPSRQSISGKSLAPDNHGRSHAGSYRDESDRTSGRLQVEDRDRNSSRRQIEDGGHASGSSRALERHGRSSRPSSLALARNSGGSRLQIEDGGHTSGSSRALERHGGSSRSKSQALARGSRGSRSSSQSQVKSRGGHFKLPSLGPG